MALSNDLTEGSIHKHLLAFAFPLITVSYTHLDVYKRQVTDLPASSVTPAMVVTADFPIP